MTQESFDEGNDRISEGAEARGRKKPSRNRLGKHTAMKRRVMKLTGKSSWFRIEKEKEEELLG